MAGPFSTVRPDRPQRKPARIPGGRGAPARGEPDHGHSHQHGYRAPRRRTGYDAGDSRHQGHLPRPRVSVESPGCRSLTRHPPQPPPSRADDTAIPGELVWYHIGMGRWSRAELESAFAKHEQLVVDIGQSWDWSRYADEFTEDALYVEHALGTFRGRDQIRDWIVSAMNTFPGTEMPVFPMTGKGWSHDVAKRWVFSREPVSGSVAPATTSRPTSLCSSTRATGCGVMRKTPTTR